MAIDLDVYGEDATLAYLMTEEARLLCEVAELRAARRSLSEAAYYLSDPMQPDERAELLAALDEHLAHAEPDLRCAERALILTSDALAAVGALLRGPRADSCLQIGHRALQDAASRLTAHLGATRAAVLLFQHATA
jgi:hypothetical protein